jgi:Na+-transporting NADH:ubiquinone oxidoreductase subunit C
VTDQQKQFSGARRDSIRNTLFVAISLSLVCSLLVASTAVLLKPRQLENAERFRQAIVLDVAGLLEPGPDIATLFAGIEVRVVNLADGSYADSIDASEFDARIAEGDPEFAVAIPEASDVANIRRRALPVHGTGLWSTMYGYLAVAGDGTTIRGLRFYEHAETPGLGDQIDDAEWRAQWSGKQLYDEDGALRIEVVRGFAQAGDDAIHQIDGISGATLTGRGVSNLVRYWTGPHGFGPYLGKIQDESDGIE